MGGANTLDFSYTFTWPEGKQVRIVIALDAQTLAAQPRADAAQPPPDWVRLTHCQCPNCPLAPSQTPCCPVALQLEPLLGHFADAASFQPVHVEVTAPERSYSADTSLQQGVSSMLGLVMATSGCPVLDALRPMARFHLPFASYEESAYRALSMYLLAQHVRAQAGEDADWSLDAYLALYESIQQVNAAFARRIQSFITNDANANALVILDCFAAMTSMDVAFRRSIPASLQPLFAAWLGRSP